LYWEYVAKHSALERLRCPYAIKDKRGNLVTNLCFQHLDSLVIAGLDPAIHHLRNTLLKMDGCPGQARA
jgi:hypothetical protein